jgi:hypothetical protein
LLVIWVLQDLNGKRRLLFLDPRTVSIGFALGTENSGTAMRHRSKIFPALIIVVVFMESIKQNRRSIWNDKKID